MRQKPGGVPSRVRLTVVLVALALVAGATAPAASTDAGADTTTSAAAGDAVTCAGPAAERPGANISLSTLTAPGSTYDDLRNASAVRAAIADGTLAEPGQDTYADAVVAYGDVVLHRVSFEGSATAVLDAMADQDRGSPGANFRALVAGDGVDLSFRGPTACPPDLALNASLDADAIRVVPDQDRESLYLVFDSDRYLVGQSESDPRADRWNYGAHSLSLSAGTVDGRDVDAAGETQWETQQRAVAFDAADDDLLRTDSGENQSFAFETTVAPGTELTVALQSLDGDVTRSGDAVVSANRTGRVTLDVPRGVYAVNVSDAEPTDLLVAAGNASGATLAFPDQEAEQPTLYQVGVVTTDGGFVVVRNESGRVVGVSDRFEAGAAHPEVELPRAAATDGEFTATVVRDAAADDGEYDAEVDDPYRVDGEPVEATASVDFRLQTPPTATTTTTRTATTQESGPPTSTRARSTSGESTGTDVPGFGVGVGVVAVLAAAPVARRE
jgi:PGF-CTERM protein